MQMWCRQILLKLFQNYLWTTDRLINQSGRISKTLFFIIMAKLGPLLAIQCWDNDLIFW